MRASSLATACFRESDGNLGTLEKGVLRVGPRSWGVGCSLLRLRDENGGPCILAYDSFGMTARKKQYCLFRSGKGHCEGVIPLQILAAVVTCLLCALDLNVGRWVPGKVDET